MTAAASALPDRAPAEPALLPEPHGHGQASAAQRDPTVCRPTCYPPPSPRGDRSEPGVSLGCHSSGPRQRDPRRPPRPRRSLGTRQRAGQRLWQGEPRPGRALRPRGCRPGLLLLSPHTATGGLGVSSRSPGRGLQGRPEVTRARLPGGAASRQASRSRPGMSSHALKSRGDRASRKASAGTRARPVLSQTTRGRECLSSSRRCAAENTPSLAHQNLRERAQGSGGARAASAPPPPAPRALRTTRAW